MEPERDIEKQLKAYAKKRREEAGAPMEMHPATRRMLQSEATRSSNRKADKSDWRQTLSRLWPRLALTSSIFVLLAIGSWALLFNRPDSESKFRLALKEKAVEVRSGGEPLGQKSPRTDSPSFAKDRELKADRSTTLSLDAQTESAATTYGFDSSIVSNGSSDGYLHRAGDLTTWSALTPTDPSSFLSTNSVSQPKMELSPIETKTEIYKSPAKSFSSVTRKRNEGEKETPAIVAATPAAPVFEDRAGQDKKALTSLDDAVKLGESQKQVFAKTTPLPAPNANRQSYTAADSTLGALGGSFVPAGKMDTATQTFSRVNKDFNGQSTLRDARKNLVLDNFSIEQSGNSIRVVDADGSTYTGSVQTVAGKPASLALNDELAQVPEQKSQVASANTPQRRLGLAEKEEALLKNDHFLSFSVWGTNLTLNQSVAFTGGFLALTNGVPGTNRIAGVTNEAKSSPSGIAGALAQPSSPQLRGQAIIGGTNQIKIDALQVNPKK